MISNMRRVVFSTRLFFNLLQRTSVRPQCCRCAYSVWTVLDSDTAFLRSGFQANFRAAGWDMYPVRHIMKASKKREEQFREQDKIPDDYEIIYRAPLAGYTQFGQIVSYVSLIMVGGFSLYNVRTASSDIDFPLSLFQTGGTNVFNFNLWQASVFLLFFMSVNIMFQRVALSYPLRIYKKNYMYILISRSYVPFKDKQVPFTKGDIKQGGSKFFQLLWSDAVFSLAGNTVVVLEEYFRTPQDFHNMFESKLD